MERYFIPFFLEYNYNSDTTSRFPQQSLPWFYFVMENTAACPQARGNRISASRHILSSQFLGSLSLLPPCSHLLPNVLPTPKETLTFTHSGSDSQWGRRTRNISIAWELVENANS